MAQGSSVAIGEIYGRWTVLEGPYRGTDHRLRWDCLCECGTIRQIQARYLELGTTHSCGCQRGAHNLLHGETGTRLHNIWKEIVRRCYDENSKSYKDYGGRGIKIYQGWKYSFRRFHAWALANGYRDDLTIERIDNNGNYEPTNCTWIPKAQQYRNQQKTRRITAWKETKSLPEWVEDPRCSVSYHTLHSRLRLGWPSSEDIIGLPKQRRR